MRKFSCVVPLSVSLADSPGGEGGKEREKGEGEEEKIGGSREWRRREEGKREGEKREKDEKKGRREGKRRGEEERKERRGGRERGKGGQDGGMQMVNLHL